MTTGRGTVLRPTEEHGGTISACVQTCTENTSTTITSLDGTHSPILSSVVK